MVNKLETVLIDPTALNREAIAVVELGTKLEQDPIFPEINDGSTSRFDDEGIYGMLSSRDRDPDTHSKKTIKGKRKVPRRVEHEGIPDDLVQTVLKLIQNLPYLPTLKKVTDYLERNKITYDITWDRMDKMTSVKLKKPDERGYLQEGYLAKDLEDLAAIGVDGIARRFSVDDNGIARRFQILNPELRRAISRDVLIAYFEQNGVTYTRDAKCNTVYVLGDKRNGSNHYLTIIFSGKNRIESIEVKEYTTQNGTWHNPFRRLVNSYNHGPSTRSRSTRSSQPKEQAPRQVDSITIEASPPEMLPGLPVSVGPHRLYRRYVHSTK